MIYIMRIYFMIKIMVICLYMHHFYVDFTGHRFKATLIYKLCVFVWWPTIYQFAFPKSTLRDMSTLGLSLVFAKYFKLTTAISGCKFPDKLLLTYLTTVWALLNKNESIINVCFPRSLMIFYHSQPTTPMYNYL